MATSFSDPCACRWDEELNPPKQLFECCFHQEQREELERLRAKVKRLQAKLEKAQ